jgi:hypothetical protein
MRCKRFKPGARREEEEYPHGSSTDEQPGSSLKDLQPFGLSYGGPLAARFRSVRRDNGSIAISGPSRHNLSRRGTVGPEARLRHGYDPPKHIGFHQTMLLKKGPLTANIDVHIRFTFEPVEGATSVIRALDLTIQIPGLLKVAEPRSYGSSVRRMCGCSRS